MPSKKETEAPIFHHKDQEREGFSAVPSTDIIWNWSPGAAGDTQTMREELPGISEILECPEQRWGWNDCPHAKVELSSSSEKFSTTQVSGGSVLVTSVYYAQCQAKSKSKRIRGNYTKILY